MVQYLKADNYKTLVNFKVDFGATNILLGSNGAGKSSVLYLLYKLRAFICGEESVKEAFPFDTLTRWQSVPVQSFELGIVYGGSEYVYQLQVAYNWDIKKNRVQREVVACDGNIIFRSEEGKATLYNDAYQEGPGLLLDWLRSGVSAVNERSDNKKLCAFKEAVNRIVVCRLNPDRWEDDEILLEPEYPSYTADDITEVYFSVLQRHPEKVVSLWEQFRQLNPAFVRTYMLGEVGKCLYFEYDHQGHKVSYKFSELSDGEKMLFALYFLVGNFVAEGGSLFLDEPDNYISLQEVVRFAQLIEDRVEGGAQCVIVSHHPKIIDYFACSDGIWLSRRSYGATVISEPPKKGEPFTYSELIASGIAYEAEQEV